MSAPLLRVEDLHVWFDLPDGHELHAVQGMTFALEEGDRYGLVGESGCGKTTTILAVMGLLPPSASVAGRVLLEGEDILARGEASVSPHRWKDIAMIFQGAMNAFNPVKRIGAQIVEPLVGLTQDLGLTLVLVTHDLPVVAQVCERAAVMYAGQIVESGPMDALYHDSHNPYTRLLFAATPDLLGEGEVASIPGVPPRLDREIEGCPFAPRCDRTFEPCGSAAPALIATGPGHEAACHLNDPAVAKAS